MKKKKESGGLLLFRRGSELEVFLAHPGGPFWAKKDLGAWTLPKGELEEGEDHLLAAIREFAEETGISPAGPYLPLGEVTQKSGKVVYAWAWEGNADSADVKSNLIEIEWPPKSGRRLEIPEVDRCEWFILSQAREKINPAQIPFLDRLRDAFSEKK